MTMMIITTNPRDSNERGTMGMMIHFTRLLRIQLAVVAAVNVKNARVQFALRYATIRSLRHAMHECDQIMIMITYIYYLLILIVNAMALMSQQSSLESQSIRYITSIAINAAFGGLELLRMSDYVSILFARKGIQLPFAWAAHLDLSRRTSQPLQPATLTSSPPQKSSYRYLLTSLNKDCLQVGFGLFRSPIWTLAFAPAVDSSLFGWIVCQDLDSLTLANCNLEPCYHSTCGLLFGWIGYLDLPDTFALSLSPIWTLIIVQTGNAGMLDAYVTGLQFVSIMLQVSIGIYLHLDLDLALVLAPKQLGPSPLLEVPKVTELRFVSNMLQVYAISTRTSTWISHS
ncbi:hypothetical protein BJ508DRAFT_315891 [Ascobolus immersus RN42]|uniref:Uncharacterized protein n=1 Tax=Ascobolus immersus RN42 TaxID=1160509 RepID=A0A3N4HBE8_ASCIM|nr:hypothetical protein BJ508DRAFT_315891 [Ascobolus immersus RN42]